MVCSARGDPSYKGPSCIAVCPPVCRPLCNSRRRHPPGCSGPVWSARRCRRSPNTESRFAVFTPARRAGGKKERRDPGGIVNLRARFTFDQSEVNHSGGHGDDLQTCSFAGLESLQLFAGNTTNSSLVLAAQRTSRYWTPTPHDTEHWNHIRATRSFRLTNRSRRRASFANRPRMFMQMHALAVERRGLYAKENSFLVQ